jgi:uncharacterized protein YbaR (Trm112 family)
MPLIDPLLKEILVCPCPHHAELQEDEAASRLRCEKCKLAFVVDDGLPIMLLEDAEAGADYDASQCGAPEAVGGKDSGE